MAKYRYLGKSGVKVNKNKSPQQIADQLNKMLGNAESLNARDKQRGELLRYGRERLRTDAVLDAGNAATGPWAKRNGIRQDDKGNWYVDESIAARNAAKGGVAK